MAEKSLQARIQNKCDTTANWAKATNFVPKKGEIIVYSDGGGVGILKMKVGDGATKVGSLKFIESDGKLSTGRKISLGTAVDSTATEFDGSKDITIPINSVSASYLSWGGRSIAEAISPIDAALSYMHSANRLQFAKPDGITIEYSTNGGSTWTDYGASNSQKISLVSGLQTSLPLGKRTSDTTAITDALRITLNASNCNVYTIGRTLLINFTTGGATGSKVKIETSTIGAPTTFTDRGSYNISGWSGWNSYPIDIGAFGGNPTQTYQIDSIRLTFTIDGASVYGGRAAVLNLLLFGEATWATPSNMAHTGHLYSWDVNQNAIFPAGITATSFNGNATSASKVNGHTVNSDVPADAKFTDTIYSLPVASSSTLGGVKIGSGLTVAADGTISAAAAYTLPTASSSVKGGIKVGTGLTMSSETLNHSNSVTAKTAYGSTATTASANGGSITVTDIKYDAQGHITGSTDRTITLSQTTYTLAGLMGSAAKGSATQPVYWNGSAWTNTTYTLGKSVPADAKFTDTVYTLPTASSTLGGVKTTSTVSATTGLTACPIIDGVVYYKDTNNTYTLAGLVGSTAIGTATNPIYWDGTKFVKTTYTLGKSVPADAKFTDTVYTLPTASSSTLGGIKLGTGLTAAADGTVNVSVGGATITLKTWTDADVA